MTDSRAPSTPVLIFAPTSVGGIAEYVREQADELARRGIEVVVLCNRHFAHRPGALYRKDASLLAPQGSGPLSRICRVLAGIASYYQLAWAVLKYRCKAVLLEANSEYYAAFWAWPHILLAWSGVRYIANFHDPVRKRWRGPRWLHALNLRLSLAPLHGGLIHATPPEDAKLPDRLRMRIVPHGLYSDYARHAPAFDVRLRFGIPGDAMVVLAFGHIADRKNLDLLVRALPEIPDMVLVAAGAPSSRQDRPGSHYAALASELGVGDRFHLVEAHIPDEEVSAWFVAADIIALTYGAGFVSQSGVLQIAANWDCPVLASGGAGPLRTTMQEFRLGEFVEPDSVPEIVRGIARIRASDASFAEAFRRYRQHASWSNNIDRLLELLG